MFILKFIKKIFCGRKPFDYNQYKLTEIKENELTKRESDDEMDKSDLISDVNSQENKDNEIRTEEKKEKILQSRMPQDQFLCSKCSSVPEILSLYSHKGELSINCPKHEEINLTVTDYLDKLKNSNFFYLNNRCKICKGKPQGMNTKMKYCLVCNYPLCAKCVSYYDFEHFKDGHIIPIGEKNDTCSIHHNEKKELYCQDCKEIICKDDKRSHNWHHVIETDNDKLQNDVEKYRKIIVERNKKLFNMIRFYRLVILSGNKETINQLENCIKKENKFDQDDKDLAIYYLKKNKLIQDDT